MHSSNPRPATAMQCPALARLGLQKHDEQLICAQNTADVTADVTTHAPHGARGDVYKNILHVLYDLYDLHDLWSSAVLMSRRNSDPAYPTQLYGWVSIIRPRHPILCFTHRMNTKQEQRSRFNRVRSLERAFNMKG